MWIEITSPTVAALAQSFTDKHDDDRIEAKV
jgi:hypothetical protein